MSKTNQPIPEILRVELSRRWILAKGLVCGLTLMLVSLPLAFFNVVLWLIIELFCIGCGFVVFLRQRKQRGVYIFYPDRISVEGDAEEAEVALYDRLTAEDLRLLQGPVERLVNVGKICIRDGEATLYGVSQFDQVRAYVEKNYAKKEGDQV